MKVLSEKCSTCFYSNTRNEECCLNCQFFDGTYCVYEEIYYDLKPIKVSADGNCERYEENELMKEARDFDEKCKSIVKEELIKRMEHPERYAKR